MPRAGAGQRHQAAALADRGHDAGQWQSAAHLRDTVGTKGVPVIDGSGPLLGGQPIVLSLDDARSSSTAWLLIGLTALNAPFKGGVMVPKPDFIVSLPTGPLGALDIPATWPAGLPSGFSTCFQWWVQDAAGPAGFAAATGLRATTP